MIRKRPEKTKQFFTDRNLSLFRPGNFFPTLMLIAGFCAAELVIRILYFGPPGILSGWKYSPEALQRTAFVEKADPPAVAYVLKKNHSGIFKGARLTTDAYGCRTVGPGHPAGKHPVRIAVTGRSVAMGAGVNDEEVFSALLQQKFERTFPGLDVEMMNCSVGGYTFVQIQAAFFARVVRRKPDVVIIPLYLGELERSVPAHPRPLAQYRLNYWRLRSYFSGSFVYAAVRYFTRTHLAPHLALDWQARAGSKGQGAGGGMVTNSDVLRRYIAALHNKGIQVILITLPLPADSRKSTMILSKQRAAIASWVRGLADKQVQWFDLTTRLQKQVTIFDRIYFSDEHPDAKVHALYADALFPQIADMLQLQYSGNTRSAGTRLTGSISHGMSDNL